MDPRLGQQREAEPPEKQWPANLCPVQDQRDVTLALRPLAGYAAITMVSISTMTSRVAKDEDSLHVYSFLNQQVLASCRVSQTGRLGRRIISAEEVGPADAVSEEDSQPL